MDEWQSYSLHDLLIFSPEAFFSVFAIANEKLWPLQFVLLLVAGALAYLAFQRSAKAHALALFILATTWLFVAIWFFQLHYSQINTLGPWLADGFFVQAALLLGVGAALAAIAFSSRLKSRLRSLHTARELEANSGSRHLGLLIFAFAVMVYPLLGMWLGGRALEEVEVFGVAPDPTAIATIGLVLVIKPRFYGVLLLIPALSLGFSALTYSAMAH